MHMASLPGCLLILLLCGPSNSKIFLGAVAPPAETAAFAAQMRTLLLQFLPDPLFQDDKKWGMQKTGPRGKLRNDGRWIKVRITAKNPATDLKLTIENMVKDRNRKEFTLRLSLPAQVDLERQTWKLGTRLYSGSTRARMVLQVRMRCELVTKVEQTQTWVPDMILRLKVLESHCGYGDLVVEHTAGVGGDAARVLGDLMIGIVKQAKPDLEQRMLEKANSAIMKAGNSKEIRISLADWLNGKKSQPRK